MLYFVVLDTMRDLTEEQREQEMWRQFNNYNNEEDNNNNDDIEARIMKRMFRHQQMPLRSCY